ncbi:PREDICTED: LOW QUALITY PROTEIN: A-kinase anchor protein 1, mitochondrial [Tauraco erythrolophus]|uniref:LOW QUALITY PROTEIN: A-kinase anchor protein 1, mitochondrial n=1 Tax=Tauraco erythrolophus TaxID=121530 RepID=UPI0005231E34|nr:PREDICTED: LOW QUALITY PROTEIN: A-kinase anchor protein 1, mitochondrial [Tauraco erythrolophus]
MSLRFRNIILYAIPGALALLGCWWMYSRRKKPTSSPDEQAVGIEEQQQEKVPENDSAPETEACVAQTLPSASRTLTQESLGITEEISNAEQSDDSSFKPPKESQMPEIAVTDSVTALCLGLEKEANTPQAFLNDEAEGVSSHKNSAVSVLPDSLESACLEQSREEEMSESIASTVPLCQEEDTQPKGGELEREKIGGVSLDKEDAEAIEQVAIQIISKVILAATEEALSGASSDVSTWICQAAAGRVETPLEMVSTVSSDQMLTEEATGADENAAATSDAAVPTSLRTEEGDQSVADPSCLTHSPLSGPVQGDTKDCRMKSRVCRESQVVDQTPVENHGGSLQKLPLVTEDSEYSTYVSEGGENVEDLLQNTMLSLASGQHSDSLSTSAAQGMSAEQSSAPSAKPPTLKLSGGSEVPYSNGILKEDGPDLHHECSRAAGMGEDHSDGSDVNCMEFVDSGCAMRKTVTRQNSKLGGESNKSDVVIWEIKVPKELVGRLIGKQGRFMSVLRQASGAKIYVSTLPYFRDSQVCHIEEFLSSTWQLFLPDGVTVEVVVANQVDAGHMFLQQHTHPTFHVLRSLDQQMYACYSQPGIPTLPTPVQVGIICAAPGLDGAWLRAQIISYFEETSEVEVRYVDYGGYEKVKVDMLRQIRSDFLSLPFQGAEVLLDNVTNYDSATGLPLIQLWNLMGDEVVSVNRTLVERGFAQWLSY